jgi:hypothetical protein
VSSFHHVFVRPLYKLGIGRHRDLDSSGDQNETNGRKSVREPNTAAAAIDCEAVSKTYSQLSSSAAASLRLRYAAALLFDGGGSASLGMPRPPNQARTVKSGGALGFCSSEKGGNDVYPNGKRTCSLGRHSLVADKARSTESGTPNDWGDRGRWITHRWLSPSLHYLIRRSFVESCMS